jgi:hypothetical protein
MKLIVCTVLASMLAGLGGCTLATPAYTAQERFAQIHRNQAFEAASFNDDVDHLLLLRPSSQLSLWNTYHRN